MPMLVIIYIMNYMDRTSVTQARLHSIQKDLGINGSLWQTGISILSVPYMGMLTPLKSFPAVSLIVSKLVSQISEALLIARTRPSILLEISQTSPPYIKSPTASDAHI